MKSVLITGAGGGIGRALVARFERAGWLVHASERKGPGLVLDVTSEASVQDCKARIGVPDVVVNNAGLGLLGPIAETSDEVLMRQLDVNVRGLLRVTRAFVPEMCRRGHGRLINVGSLAGTFTLPWFGSYSASKYAVEAMTDALRVEVAPFGVKVSLVEPTIVGTGFVDGAVASLEAAAPHSLWHQPLRQTVADRATFSRVQISPEQVAEALFTAATARRPRARYRVGALSSALLRLTAVLPTAVVDAALRVMGRLQAPALPPAPRANTVLSLPAPRDGVSP